VLIPPSATSAMRDTIAIHQDSAKVISQRFDLLKF